MEKMSDFAASWRELGAKGVLTTVAMAMAIAMAMDMVLATVQFNQMINQTSQVTERRGTLVNFGFNWRSGFNLWSDSKYYAAEPGRLKVRHKSERY